MQANHFPELKSSLNPVAIKSQQKKQITRLLVRNGADTIVLKTEEIALFFTTAKVVFAIDKENNKYIVDKNLSVLMGELDNKSFFRANRQYILNINFIRSFQTHKRVKIVVALILLTARHTIIISQEQCSQFKKWILD